MTPLSPGFAVHKGLRGQILLELKQHQPLTAKALADRHGVSVTAVRRHLKELELDQLIVYRREQRGPGAPTFSYQLTPDGGALFPKRYEETLPAAPAVLGPHRRGEGGGGCFSPAFCVVRGRGRGRAAPAPGPATRGDRSSRWR